MYIKVESPDEPDYLKITPALSPKIRLKVGTFKTEKAGFRIGERFLRIIFDNAVKFKVEEIYVTMFSDKRDNVIQLKNLMEKWGFEQYGIKNDTGEIVLVKSMIAYNRNKDAKFNYPIVRKDANYFFLPILPKYHTDLFPDKILRSESPSEFGDKLAHRYAIEKVYLTGAFNIQAKPNDVLLIYRMKDGNNAHYSSVVTGMAIIQDMKFSRSAEDCINFCKNRSVFSEEEIRLLFNNYPNAVSLLDSITFKKKVTLKELRDMGIFDYNEGPRPFRPISKQQFCDIFKLGMGVDYE